MQTNAACPPRPKANPMTRWKGHGRIGSFDRIPLDTTDVPQLELDLANKTRSNLFPWRGQFSPQLVACLLARYAKDADVVLDPFAGVGTTIFEAARRALAAIAVEINPAAVAMAQTSMFIPRPRPERVSCLSRARDLLASALPDKLPLFDSGGGDGSSTTPTLAVVGLLRRHPRSRYLSNVFTNVLLRMCSEPEEPTVTDALRGLKQHEAVVLDLPHASAAYRVEHGDARSLPLPARSVDLVLTSPPYINVFNYHQNNRPAMELLGWDLLTVAKSELGSNRKHRGNRFLTVVQYCLDMAEALAEMRRVLRPRGRVLIVVGRESNVRGVPFRNGALVADLASFSGLDLVRRQERKFTNKFGTLIVEDILHLRPTDAPPYTRGQMSAYAQDLLRSALRAHLKPDVANDLRLAIDGALSVAPSPSFTAKAALRP